VKNEADQYGVTSGTRLCVNALWFNLFSMTMFAIRIYISALTLLFLFLVIANRGLGILEAVVITCALIYLIIDARDELQKLKLELQCLQDLEQRISALLR